MNQSTVKARITLARELLAVKNAIPEDILVLLTQHWLPIHAVSSTVSGKLIAASTSPAEVKSQLAREFEPQENWDPAAHLGQPMHSMQIGDMINGYHNEAAVTW